MHEFETPEQIVAAIHQGDRKAEAVLLERFYRKVLYILRKRTRDDESARDLCQEAFRITIERLRREPLAEPEKLAAFIHSIATKLNISDVRKAERRQTYPDSDMLELVPDQRAGQDVELDRQRAAIAVRLLLAELSNERDQMILQRFYIDERDKEEICAELALDHRHFDKVISRARTRFRDLIETSSNELLLGVARGWKRHES